MTTTGQLVHTHFLNDDGRQFNFQCSHHAIHTQDERRKMVESLWFRCCLNRWMERLARVTTWTESACMKCNFPYQNRLVEALPMEGALHFFTNNPIGRCESHSLCACNHFRFFMSNLQFHYPGFSWNGFLAGDAIYFGFHLALLAIFSLRHFQTLPLLLTSTDFSSFSTICSYLL